MKSIFAQWWIELSYAWSRVRLLTTFVCESGLGMQKGGTEDVWCE